MLQKKLLGRKVCYNPFTSTTKERKDTYFCACPLQGVIKAHACCFFYVVKTKEAQDYHPKGDHGH